jgi:hypothetical protein
MGQLANVERQAAARSAGTSRRERAWRIGAVLLTTLFCCLGCDPAQMLNMMLTPFADFCQDPECPLTVKDKESNVVIIATHDDVEDGTAFRGANDVVTRRLIALLENRYKEHKDKVKIVPFTKVQAYLNKNPDWVTKSKREIGKHFKADYVVFLEMGSMSMNEKGSNGTLFRGTVEINISVIDVNQDEGEGAKFEKAYACTYPLSGAKGSTDVPAATFRGEFLEHIAKDLAVEFAPFETRNKVED